MFNDIYCAVEIEEMLEARERRSERQRRLQRTHKMPLLSFTMNIAGEYKRSFAIDKAFDTGAALIMDRLSSAGIAPAAIEQYDEKTGCQLLMALPADAMLVKRLMTDIEEMAPIGRLFDIDVLAPGGEKLSRSDMGVEKRRCIICGKEAFICSRSRAHSADELRREIERMLSDYFNGKLCGLISSMAIRSLMYEVAVTPKPGLVDRFNNGSHRDMDFFSFIDSACALSGYFREAALAGITRTALSPAELFSSLRWPGMLAEAGMLKSTGGVNTHKGAIFSIGILCAALGRLAARGAGWSPESLSSLSRAMASGPALEELSRITSENAATTGERLYHSKQITGVRGEAASGFASALKYGLPTLMELTAQGKGPDEAGSAALTRLMAWVTDTNVISRSSIEQHSRLQSQLRLRLKQGEIPLPELLEIDSDYISENISPGGCADLLAVCFLMMFAGQTSVFPDDISGYTPEALGRMLGHPLTYEGEATTNGYVSDGYYITIRCQMEIKQLGGDCAARLIIQDNIYPCLASFDSPSLIRCLLPNPPKQEPHGFVQLEIHSLCPDGQRSEKLRFALSLLKGRGL